MMCAPCLLDEGISVKSAVPIGAQCDGCGGWRDCYEPSPEIIRPKPSDAELLHASVTQNRMRSQIKPLLQDIVGNGSIYALRAQNILDGLKSDDAALEDANR